MKEITKDMVIKVRYGSTVVDMVDIYGARVPVEGNAIVVEKTTAKKKGVKHG